MKIQYVITEKSWNNQDPEDHGTELVRAIFDNIELAKAYVDELSKPPSIPNIEDYINQLKESISLGDGNSMSSMSYDEWCSNVNQYDYTYRYYITEVKGINGENDSTAIVLQYPLSPLH